MVYIPPIKQAVAAAAAVAAGDDDASSLMKERRELNQFFPLTLQLINDRLLINLKDEAMTFIIS